MGLESKARGSESRFSAYVEALTSVLGHADRAVPFRSYCAGLLLPGDRKSVEPMAARVQPARVQATHQSLHHFVAKAEWSDDTVLAAVRAHVLPVIERHGKIRAKGSLPSESDGTATTDRRFSPRQPNAYAPLARASEGRSEFAALQAENQALRQEAAQARQILRSAIDYAIITMDGQGCTTGWNPGAQNIVGYSEDEVLGRSGDIVFTAEDRDSGRFTLELCRALEEGRASNERWHVRRDGTRFWASGLMMPLLDADGQSDGFLNILRDRSEIQVQTERRELLMAEMNHRVKNTLAMVQAIAAQTSRHTAAVDSTVPLPAGSRPWRARMTC